MDFVENKEKEKRKIKVLLAKTGLDSHDKGIRMVARGLKDAGMEVIYAGLYQTPEQVVKTALEEAVDVVGLGVHTGVQRTLFPHVRALLNANRGEGIILIGGGVIPEEDIRALKAEGAVAEVFGPGTPLQKIADWIARAAAS